MKRLILLLFVSFSLSGCASKTPIFDSNLKLSFNSPAAVWEETLPLGNGRVGMMPDGGVNREKIVLNEITMWSGSWEDASNPTALKALPEIRELLIQGKNREAEELTNRSFTCGGKGTGRGRGANVPFGCYQTMGDLIIDYKRDNSVTEEYERELDLNTATAYYRDGIFEREYFTSFADDVSIIRISKASKSPSKELINCTIRLSRAERSEVFTEVESLIMSGTLNSGTEGIEGLRYYNILKVKNNGGRVLYSGDSVVVEGASELIVFLSSATNYQECAERAQSGAKALLASLKGEAGIAGQARNDSGVRNDNEKFEANRLLSAAMKKSYKALKRDHIASYSSLFQRLKLSMSGSPTASFATLYLQYGRYLLISSSRVGLLPPNLQGLWANTIQTPWNGDYHLNINVQMNLWIAEVCNLSELHLPLIELTKSLVNSGEATALSFYGAKGWVTHMKTNLWLDTAPGEEASWGATNTSAGWLCQHLWNHYLYTMDKNYLAEVYPVMKGASEFFLSMLIEEPTHGWLVTAPTTSPENAFYIKNKNGKREAVSLCMGSTMDNQIIKELFTNTAEAAAILGVDSDFAMSLDSTKKRLPPHIVSKNGSLQEWLEDYEEVEPTHRHVSHLYGLHPSNLISKSKTPELMEACRATLDRRGDGGTGWSRAWKVNFWARLGDGERALKLLEALWKPAFNSETSRVGSGTYPNFFCSHPPFQIDGNFGGASGIAEMLIQSFDGYIELLPALPTEWSDGYFEGFKVEGNAEVSCRWENRRIKELSIKALTPGEFVFLLPDYLEISKLSLPSKSYSINGNLLKVKIDKKKRLFFRF